MMIVISLSVLLFCVPATIDLLKKKDEILLHTFIPQGIHRMIEDARRPRSFLSHNIKVVPKVTAWLVLAGLLFEEC